MAEDAASTLLEIIDANAQADWDDGQRSHLGASKIGETCSRALWYGFRWVDYEYHDGRHMRLFNRGHLEEARFVGYLRRAGFTLHHVLDEQTKVSGVMGHYGGSPDGVATPPENLAGIFPPAMLLEFKTNSTGSGFTDLKKRKMRLAKPVHFAQASTYGRYLGLQWCLYMNVNKNDDDLHIELVELDWSVAAEFEERARMIISSDVAPQRFCKQAEQIDAKICAFRDVCFNGKEPMRSCRSCQYAQAVEDKQWHCRKFNGIMPKEFIPDGCQEWLPVK